jgi:hypothetical protein
MSHSKMEFLAARIYILLDRICRHHKIQNMGGNIVYSNCTSSQIASSLDFIENKILSIMILRDIVMVLIALSFIIPDSIHLNFNLHRMHRGLEVDPRVPSGTSMQPLQLRSRNETKLLRN